MQLTIYQVDAFTNTIFKGNPAAVCPLKTWLPDDMMLRIAMENNLSETAFYVIRDNRVELRWFTPGAEVALCGHATLASAFVLHHFEKYAGSTIPFFSPQSGELPVSVENDKFVLDFPVDQSSEIPLTAELKTLTDHTPVAAFKGKTDYMLVFKTQEEIEKLQPDFRKMIACGARGIIATAPGVAHDFVSRFFAPAVGVDEDPVTGSAHTQLTPYWSQRLNKITLSAFQCSRRGGELHCQLSGNRVLLSGHAVMYMKGEIFI